jgi:hypothetical protein
MGEFPHSNIHMKEFEKIAHNSIQHEPSPTYNDPLFRCLYFAACLRLVRIAVP